MVKIVGVVTACVALIAISGCTTAGQPGPAGPEGPPGPAGPAGPGGEPGKDAAVTPPRNLVAEIGAQGRHLTVDATASKLLDGDIFLTRVRFDPATIDAEKHRLYRHEERQGDIVRVGYGVAGSTADTLPTAGSATYRGGVAGTMVSSVTGRSEFTGTFAMDATFTANGGEVKGVISSGRIPARVEMLPTPIKDGRFGGGELATNQIVWGGTITNPTSQVVPVGVVQNSHYEGGFFDTRGREVGGVFSLEVHGIPESCSGGPGLCSGNQDIELVGGFSGKR